MITRVTSDVFQLQLFTQMLLRMGLIAPVMIVSSLVQIFKSNFQFAIINLVSIPFILGVVIYVDKKSIKYSNDHQTKMLKG